jgi:hypothetical protein
MTLCSLCLIFSLPVVAVSLTTLTDVSLFQSNGTTYIDQDNTLAAQSPNITNPAVTQNAVLVDANNTIGSSLLDVDLTKGTIKVYADSALSSSDPRIITSAAVVTYNDRLRLFGTSTDQLVNVQLVVDLSGDISGPISNNGALVYSLNGIVRNVVFTESSHSQPFVFNDTISTDILVKSNTAPFISFHVHSQAQSSGTGIADLSNTLNYKLIISGNVTAQLESGLPLITSTPTPAVPEAEFGDFIDWNPLIKDSVAGSPGLETIVPRIVLKDSNTDGVEDQAFLSFDVWAGGTRNLLFRTKQRGVNLPALPCTSPVNSDVDFDIKFTNETGTRSNAVVLFNVSCAESGTFEEKETFKAVVYSADVTQSPTAGGTSWRQAWSADAVSFDNLDWDNDTKKEIILNLLNDQAGNTSIRTIMLQQSDGTVEADTTYKLVDIQ